MANGMRLAIWGAILADAGMAAAKFTAAGFTGSSAMLSEGIHSTIDTANSALLLLGERRSKMPRVAPPAHPLVSRHRIVLRLLGSRDVTL